MSLRTRTTLALGTLAALGLSAWGISRLSSDDDNASPTTQSQSPDPSAPSSFSPNSGLTLEPPITETSSVMAEENTDIVLDFKTEQKIEIDSTNVQFTNPEKAQRPDLMPIIDIDEKGSATITFNSLPFIIREHTKGVIKSKPKGFESRFIKGQRFDVEFNEPVTIALAHKARYWLPRGMGDTNKIFDSPNLSDDRYEDPESARLVSFFIHNPESDTTLRMMVHPGLMQKGTIDLGGGDIREEIYSLAPHMPMQDWDVDWHHTVWETNLPEIKPYTPVAESQVPGQVMYVSLELYNGKEINPFEGKGNTEIRINSVVFPRKP